tara:strand:+ start:978 stop:1379 length:402 start_codon:yes stop_codon:yes gene_type:complete
LKFLFTFFICTLFTLPFYGQKDSNCDWVDTLENSKNTEDQLQLLQANFGPCALVIAQGHPVSSYTSSFWFGDEEKFIRYIRPEEVDALNLLRGEAAQTLYGPNFESIIVISFKDKGTMYEIQKKVIERLKKDN